MKGLEDISDADLRAELKRRSDLSFKKFAEEKVASNRLIIDLLKKIEKDALLEALTLGAITVPHDSKFHDDHEHLVDLLFEDDVINEFLQMRERSDPAETPRLTLELSIY